MKKITSILLINIFPLLAIAQSENSPETNGVFHQLIVNEWMISLGLFLSVIAIMLQLFRRRKSSKYTHASTGEVSNRELQQDLTRLKSDLNKKPGAIDFNELAERLKIIEEKVDQMEPPVWQKEWTNLTRKSIIQAADLVPAGELQAAAPAQTDRVLYAKLADLDDGFSSSILSLGQNGEQIYEIQTNGDTAVYRISSDPNAQKYALAEFTFTLGKACELLNQPFKGCQIVLQKEGILNKTGGNWIIEEKAKIEFK